MIFAGGLVWLAGFFLFMMFVPGVSKLVAAWLGLLLAILVLLPYRSFPADRST